MNKPSPTFWFLIFVLGYIVVRLMVPQNGLRSSDNARRTAAFADIRGGLNIALDRFAADCGRFPTTAEGFQSLLTCPASISQKLWHGPYLDRIPQDPWGHEYAYRYPGIHSTNNYDLYSAGPDGITGDLDDIGNWQVIARTNKKPTLLREHTNGTDHE